MKYLDKTKKEIEKEKFSVQIKKYDPTKFLGVMPQTFRS